MTTVTVYHNVSRDAGFGLNNVFRTGDQAPAGVRAYQDEKTLQWSWKAQAETEAERHELVRVFEYEADTDSVNNDYVLAKAWDEFNVGTSELAQAYRARRLRSLSVGDVLKVGYEFWAVESLGFRSVKAEELRVLNAHDAELVVRERYQFRPAEHLTVTVPLPDPYQAFGEFHPEYTDGDAAANAAVPAREGYAGAELSQAELNAFTDAVEDYVKAFEHEEEPARLRYEGQELLARFGVQA